MFFTGICVSVHGGGVFAADTPCPVHAGIYPPPPVATAADGTHPTGMHCVKFFFTFTVSFLSILQVIQQLLNFRQLTRVN